VPDRLAAQLDGAVAAVQLGDLEVVVLGVAPLHVGDGVLGAGDALGHAGGLVLALTGPGPGLGRLVLPRAVAGGLEELGGVLGGARLVGAEEDGDLVTRQRGVLVQRRDLRVVPGLDRAVEDLGQHLGVEHEGVHAVDVVGEGDRPTTMGRFQAGLPWQRSFALSASTTPSFSSVLSAESEPAKSTRPL
jgi:hypothetical protein